jgi:large subunit ribosomal protein L10
MDKAQTKERRRTATHVARPAKVKDVEVLVSLLGQSSAAILTDFRGLNVRELAELRRKLREAGAEYKVVKNTLLHRAAQSVGVANLAPLLEGPTAIAVSRTDPVAPARILLEYMRQMRKLEIKGGLVEGLILTAAQIKRLADLPARPQLLASALGSMRAPLTSLAGVLSGLQRNLVYALDQIRKRQEQAAA